MLATVVRMSAVILAFLCFGANRAVACSCGVLSDIPGNCHEFKSIGPSFVGTVIEIENPPNDQDIRDQSGISRYHFRVDENISGFDVKEVDIYSGRGGGDCSYHFRKGESYFVTPFKANKGWASVSGVEQGRWTAGICGETQPAARAGALMAELRARKPGSVVEGVLRTMEPPYIAGEELPDVSIELKGKYATFTTRSDKDGVYRFVGIPTGTYEIAVQLPRAFPRLTNKSGGTTGPVTLTEQACVAKDLYAAVAAQTEP
jgi:hypothetical protein